MERETFVDDGFESYTENIVSEIESVVERDDYEGKVEYETYQEEDSPVDVEITITGSWADLTGIAVVVQESEYFTTSAFVFTDDGDSHVVLGLRFHPDVKGLFEYRHY